MKAMLLAAGRGERMRPLTDTVPKALLPVAGRPLIEHHITALAEAGVTDIVVNHAHLGEQIVARLGNGERLGVHIRYSDESRQRLDTGGGIFHALPLIDADQFLVINADIWTDYPRTNLLRGTNDLAHLVLVDNPPQHPGGDFCLQQDRVTDKTANASTLTFSGMGIYHRDLFNDCNDGPFALAPLLRRHMAGRRIGGEHYRGQWTDVGTPDRLQALQQVLTAT